MKTAPLVLGFVLLCPLVAHAQDAATRKQFDALVARTYNFKIDEPHLTRSQVQAREVSLDRFWNTVKTNKTKFLPCLRQKVADPKADPFFRFDGSNLLVTLAPTLDSKRLLVAVYTDTPLPLDVINTERWVGVLTQRGTEGFDVSKAAKRALDDEKVTYTPSNIIPEYADESLSHTQAAFFLWGSQSEERTTPQLFALANDTNYAQREAALFLLLAQATPEAELAIQKINRNGLSADTLTALDHFQQTAELTPRAKPKTTRAQFLNAFNRFVAGNTAPLLALTKAVPDGEHDAAAVLLPADLPLLRRVRRRFLLGCNRHSVSYYSDFTNIIFAVMKKTQPKVNPPK